MEGACTHQRKTAHGLNTVQRVDTKCLGSRERERERERGREGGGGERERERPILFCGPTEAITQLKSMERIGKNYVEWTGRVEIRTRTVFLAVGEACVAIF